MFAFGLVCGGLLAWPVARLARREAVAARARALAPRGGPARSGCELPRRIAARSRAVLGPVIRVAGAPYARRRTQRRDRAVQRELPVVVDVVAVALASGCTPYLAVQHAARFGPHRAGRALRDVVRSCSLGSSLDAALTDLGAALAPMRPLAEALRTTARLGSPATPALGRLSDELRSDLRRRAEAHARTVPVRLCFPLVACVLPAFALLTVVPAVLGGLHA